MFMVQALRLVIRICLKPCWAISGIVGELHHFDPFQMVRTL